VFFQQLLGETDDISPLTTTEGRKKLDEILGCSAAILQLFFKASWHLDMQRKSLTLEYYV
jgi:hypothetical protein